VEKVDLIRKADAPVLLPMPIPQPVSSVPSPLLHQPPVDVEVDARPPVPP
jgi:hypothetical protein